MRGENEGAWSEGEGANAEGRVAGDKDKIDNQHPKFKNLRTISVAFDKAWLADEGDVELYLKAMREALLAEIHKGEKIQI